MQRLDRFESTSTTARPLHLAAGSTIRVCHGRLWLTMDGQLDDVWLAPGDVWVSDRPVTVWLSGEPQASFELLHPVAPKASGLPWGARLSPFALTAGARALALRLSTGIRWLTSVQTQLGSHRGCGELMHNGQAVCAAK